jgi:hypothetical protein
MCIFPIMPGSAWPGNRAIPSRNRISALITLAMGGNRAQLADGLSAPPAAAGLHAKLPAADIILLEIYPRILAGAKTQC